jgi:hypothetical protein
MADHENNANVGLIYQENAKIAAIFVEWRHKVLAAWFAVISAVCAAAGWLFQQTTGRKIICIPMLLGAAFSCIAAFLDHRNARIMAECNRLGADLETRLLGRRAIFGFIGATHERGITYTRVLRVAYVAGALLFLSLAIASLCML